jgi:hypothetical protein
MFFGALTILNTIKCALPIQNLLLPEPIVEINTRPNPVHRNIPFQNTDETFYHILGANVNRPVRFNFYIINPYKNINSCTEEQKGKLSDKKPENSENTIPEDPDNVEFKKAWKEAKQKQKEIKEKAYKDEYEKNMNEVRKIIEQEEKNNSSQKTA